MFRMPLISHSYIRFQLGAMCLDGDLTDCREALSVNGFRRLEVQQTSRIEYRPLSPPFSPSLLATPLVRGEHVLHCTPFGAALHSHPVRAVAIRAAKQWGAWDRAHARGLLAFTVIHLV